MGWARRFARTSRCSTSIAGVIIVVMGLAFAGLVRPAGSMRERRWQVLPSRLGEWAAPVMGMAFAFGWTPCIGPALAAVLSLASDTHTLGRGELMLVAYSLGLGVPFVVAGVAFGRLTGVLAFAAHPPPDHQPGLGADAGRPRRPPSHRQPARAVHRFSATCSTTSAWGGSRRCDQAPDGTAAPTLASVGTALMDPAIRFRSAVALVGRFPVLAGVDLDVARGEIVLLQGANGAGKTSLLRACAGLLRVVAGEAGVLGDRPGRAGAGSCAAGSACSATPPRSTTTSRWTTTSALRCGRGCADGRGRPGPGAARV